MRIFHYVFTFVMPIALFCASGVYFASVGCRYARWRHRRVGWYWGVLGALGSGAFALALVWLGLRLHPGELGKGIMAAEVLRPMFIFASSVALIPALLTVWYYRRQFSNDAPEE